MLFSSLFEKRQGSLENPSTSLADPATWLFATLGGRPTASNVVVNEKTAYQITAFWSSVNIIANTLAILPIQLLKRLPNNDIEVVPNHPVLKLLNVRPNTEASPTTAKSTVQAHVLTWGNGFFWVRRTAGGPDELWPLLPSSTRVVRGPNRELFFESRLSDESGALDTLIFPREDVLHFPGLTHNGLVGLSPIRVQREMLGSAIATQDFGARFFGNGAQPGGLITFPAKVADPDEIRQQVEEKAGGANALRTLIIDQGAKYERIGIPPEDAQFLQTKEFTIAEVARMFNLPLHFLGKMGQATFNNLEQMGNHFIDHTMAPWFKRWEDELTWKLLTDEEREAGLFFKFNADALRRGDIKTRYLSYQSGINAGWLTRNEARRFEDLNPIDGLNEPLQPLNMMPLTDGDDEDGGTGGNERVMIIIRAAAERIIRKEIQAVRRMIKKHDGDLGPLQVDLGKFYDSHADMLIENLAVSPQFARQYCRAHELNALNNVRQFGDIERAWLVNHTVELAGHAVKCNGAGSTDDSLLEGPIAE